MMKNCSKPFCNQWAQWAVIYPPLDQGPMKLFCTVHKQDEEVKNSGIDVEDNKIKFLFVGAIPNGVDHTKYRPYFKRKPQVGRVIVEGSDLSESGISIGSFGEQGIASIIRDTIKSEMRRRSTRRGKK